MDMPASPHAVICQHGRRWLGQLTARLLPRACLLCEAPCLDQPLCAHCRDALPGRGRLRCPRCALPLSARPLSADSTSPAPPCPQCQQHPLALTATFALADYLPPLDRALVALKFGQQLQLARPLGVLLMEHLLADPVQPLQQVDALVPIPLSGPRLAERGFNQSLQLARGMRAHAPGACPPIRTDWLLRVRDTARQSSLPRAQRQKNLRGAFSVPAPDRVAGQHLALVDDVMTSGNTLNEAAQTLLAAGAASVMALVVARTPQN
jgi:putative competence protein f-related protein